MQLTAYKRSSDRPWLRSVFSTILAQQAQMLGAVERNRLELLDNLTAYYVIVLRTSNCCVNGPMMVADVAETDW